VPGESAGGSSVKTTNHLFWAAIRGLTRDAFSAHTEKMSDAASQNEPLPREPVFNNAPAIVLWLGLAIAGVTALQLLGPPRLEDWLLRSGAIVTGYEQPPRPLGGFAPYILHVFIHGGFLHLAMNLAALAAFGPPVARDLGRGLTGGVWFLAFFFLCGLAGGLAQQVSSLQPGLALGASSAISGLLPAAGYARGGWRGAARLGAPWLVINLVLIGVAPIAWAAHLGGLAAGWLAYPALSRITGAPSSRNVTV